MDGNGATGNQWTEQVELFDTPGALGCQLIEMARAHSDCVDAKIVWHMDDYTEKGGDSQGQSWWYSPSVRRGLLQGEAAQVAYQLCDQPSTVVIVLTLVEDADIHALTRHLEEPFHVGGHRLSHLISSTALSQTQRKADKGQELHRAFQAIANYAGSNLDLYDIFRGIHAELGPFLGADTLSIIACDASQDIVRYVYHVDKQGSPLPGQGRPLPLDDVSNTLLSRLMSQGDAVVEHTTEYARGSAVRHWAGAALTHRGRVTGALCIGSIERAVYLLEEDRILLAFAASHILLAMERHGWRSDQEFMAEAVRPQAARLRQRASLHPMDAAVMKAELRWALEKGQFEAHLQPIYRLRDGAIAGFEALLRWNHPERGMLSPYDFIDVAVDCDLIVAIDWHMFALSCQAFADDAGGAEYLSLNVSAAHLVREDFTARLLELLATWKVSPERIVVELTEDVFVDRPDTIRETLHRLREAGIRTALDDFGTGYSSLHTLHSLPVSMLKIDRAFVERMGDDQDGNGSAVVAAILTLAQVMGIDVIAEGVETEGQAERLKAMGCGYGQGFWFGRPLPMTSSRGCIHGWASQPIAVW